MLKDIHWPESRSYNSKKEYEPFEFYIEGLTNSKELSLLLGYFSSAAINLVATGFASFISKGGKLRMVINHFLSDKDKKAVEMAESGDNDYRVFDLNDIVTLEKVLNEYDKQFFECIAYLIKEKRIEIKIIRPKYGNGIAHYKSGVFSDGQDCVGFQSSCNFTLYGLSENLEGLQVFLGWEDNRSKIQIKEQLQMINDYFNEVDEDVKYLSVKEIEVAIRDTYGSKDINELLVQEEQLVKKKVKLIQRQKFKKKMQSILNEIETINKNPRFPYPGGPRDYQTEAYTNWVSNGKKGLFAMATGTGKTITSLNCVLKEFEERNSYKFIVIVPTTALANQWINEIENMFNFQNTVMCCSINKEWERNLKSIGKNIVFQRETNYAIVTTYATFKKSKFQTIFKDHFYNDFGELILIADEAHTMGSPGFIKVLPDYINKRIGLSATPERQFDENGNKVLTDFFFTEKDKYTYEFNMKNAIEKEVLCRYFYYPKIVELEQEEQDRYIKITKKLSSFIDPETGQYRDSTYVKMLLIQRKSIIHKASQKKEKLISIVKEIGKDNFKNAFIYVPEGIEVDYSEEENSSREIEEENDNLINVYINSLYENFKLKMNKFTGETKDRDIILQQFKDEKLDVLLAMKCLDEGVDIPQTKYAIFCSSTGNPRQYVQRRGRVLRNFPGKENAIIYDLIVKPVIDHTDIDEKLSKIEKNIFLTELRRLVNFAVLSENKDSCLKSLEPICYNLGIDIYELANKELKNYE